MCPFALPATFCVIENCYRGGFTQLLVKQFQNLQSFLLAHAFQLPDSSCCFPLAALGMTCLLWRPRGAVAPLRLVWKCHREPPQMPWAGAGLGSCWVLRSRAAPVCWHSTAPCSPRQSCAKPRHRHRLCWLLHLRTAALFAEPTCPPTTVLRTL